MKTPTWKRADLADPLNDLCGRRGGVYYDIVRSVNGTWSCLRDSVRLVSGLPSREAAIEWFAKN